MIEGGREDDGKTAINYESCLRLVQEHNPNKVGEVKDIMEKFTVRQR